MIAAGKETLTHSRLETLDQGGPIFVSNRRPSRFARMLLAELKAQDQGAATRRPVEVVAATT